MTTIFWAGDSTVQYNDILTFPQTGIGQVMNLFLKPEVQQETKEHGRFLLRRLSADVLLMRNI